MKTTLLIIGLIGLTAINGYAQDKSCACKKKTVYHHVHHKKAVTPQATVVVPQFQGPLYLPAVSVVTVAAVNNPQPKSTCVIDSKGNIEYGSNNTYLGYYTEDHPDCDVYDQLVSPHTDLLITSPAFTNYGVMPAKYSCQGQGVNPPLSISNIPDQTQSLAIVMFDPNASTQKSTTYWLIWDIDTTGFIPENFLTDHMTQNPDNKQYGYQGVCPVAGTHDYHFRVYALNTKLLLDRHANQATLESAILGHVLAKGELVGKYNRHLD